MVDQHWLEKRGHAFSLAERDPAEPDEDPRWKRILAGRPKVRPAPAQCADCHAAAAGGKPLGCEDCHDPRSAVLRLTRKTPAASGTYAALNTAVCAQCHRTYITEWRHAETGARVVDAHHPQWEIWREGIHARAGVSCADCHMPTQRRGAMRVTDHRARSPLEMLGPACGRCHHEDSAELRARVREIQDRTKGLMSRAEDALVSAIDGMRPGEAVQPLEFQTEAQKRILMVAADRSAGFHAPQETARLLGEAIDFARQAELLSLRHGPKATMGFPYGFSSTGDGVHRPAGTAVAPLEKTATRLPRGR